MEATTIFLTLAFRLTVIHTEVGNLLSLMYLSKAVMEAVAICFLWLLLSSTPLVTAPTTFTYILGGYRPPASLSRPNFVLGAARAFPRKIKAMAVAKAVRIMKTILKDVEAAITVKETKVLGILEMEVRNSKLMAKVSS